MPKAILTVAEDAFIRMFPTMKERRIAREHPNHGRYILERFLEQARIGREDLEVDPIPDDVVVLSETNNPMLDLVHFKLESKAFPEPMMPGTTTNTIYFALTKDSSKIGMEFVGNARTVA